MGNEASRTSAVRMMEDIHGNIEQTLEKYRSGKPEKPDAGFVDASPDSNENNYKKCQFNVDQPLTPEQVTSIKWSWEILKHEIDHVGMLAFLHLFENSPEAKHNFKMFKDINMEDLQTSELFRNHSSRVVSVIKKVVEKIDTPQAYLSYLKILGQKHIMYEADTRYIDQMGFMFLGAIQPTLEKENAWNDETSEAWETLLTVIIGTMSNTINGGV